MGNTPTALTLIPLSFLAFQSFIKHFVIQWNLLSISIPCSVKEYSRLSGISGHILSLVLIFFPKGIILVLSRFPWRPYILLKLFMYWTQAFNDAIHLSIKKDVSSAKVCGLIFSSVCNLMHLKCLLLVNFIRSIFTAMIKMKGEILSPWGAPFSRSIFSIRWPSRKRCATPSSC